MGLLISCFLVPFVVPSSESGLKTIFPLRLGGFPGSAEPQLGEEITGGNDPLADPSNSTQRMPSEGFLSWFPAFPAQAVDGEAAEVGVPAYPSAAMLDGDGGMGRIGHSFTAVACSSTEFSRQAPMA